ncbi:MAG: hypothetical protein IPJ20_25715 [Flammeovirgaceae bacterium]|nr:hypothetical protein [Flammeovirgaceae bacterium]
MQKVNFPSRTRDVEKEYAGYKIEETAKIVSKGITTYEAEVEKEEKTFELIFDNNGKLLTKKKSKKRRRIKRSGRQISEGLF